MRQAPAARERVQKVLAGAGMGSRREIESWIRTGRIQINGVTAVLGDRVGPGDRVQLDGRDIATKEHIPHSTRVIAYYKPAGEISTRRDERGRPTVFDALPPPGTGRWISIGRLDVNSSGLLLFTNDGSLAHALMHPSARVEREYAVRVRGTATQAQLDRLLQGVDLEDGPARFTSINDGGGEGANHWYHVVIREGRKREVRRLWANQGLTVSRLIRIRFGPVALSRSMRSGKVRELSPGEVAALKRAGRRVDPASDHK